MKKPLYIFEVFGQDVPVYMVKGLKEKGDVAQYKSEIPCIEVDEEAVADDNLAQVILHELGHAVLFRTAVMQTSLTEDTAEVIVDNFATFMVENFDIEL